MTDSVSTTLTQSPRFPGQVPLHSYYSECIARHIEQFNLYLLSEFRLCYPPEYFSSIPGDRYGIHDPGEVEPCPDMKSGPNARYVQWRHNLLLCYVYEGESAANYGVAFEMMDIPHIVANFKNTAAAQDYGFIFDVVWDERGGINRVLRQPIDQPTVYAADITATILTKCAIRLNANGTDKHPNDI